MQLLSLTLDGFKSFAQKTTIKFEPGMTAKKQQLNLSPG